MAVDHAHLAGLDHDGAVAKHALGVQFAKAAHDNDLVAPGRFSRALHRRPVDGLGEAPRLARVRKHITADAQLGQNHQRGSFCGRARDRTPGSLAAVLRLPEPRGKLGAGNPHRRRS